MQSALFMRASMLGILSMRDPQETNAPLQTNVMDKGLVLLLDGAKEHQDLQKMQITNTMSLLLNKNAHTGKQNAPMPTDITIVMEIEDALILDCAKEKQDERSNDYLKNIKNLKYFNLLFFTWIAKTFSLK